MPSVCLESARNRSIWRRNGDVGWQGGRRYAAWLDPQSPYYQAWLGAYAIYVEDGPPYGYDEKGSPRPEMASELLEADQRLVLRTVGLIAESDPRPRVRVAGDFPVEHVVAWAALAATLVKFFALATYRDSAGQDWRRGLELRDECLQLLDRVGVD